MPAWCSSRTSLPASRSVPIRARSPRRNACAPAASTTISTTSATPRGTTPSSRCSAISRSAITSRSEPSNLPRPSIDTGMGLERVAAVLQGTHDNYKIDLFGALISHVADLTGVEPEGERAVSHRVIADHLRASSFLIADGVLPSNEGRGYVLRRIMRRAMRHAELLGAREPLMWRLVPTLTREMGQAYSELTRAEALITETLKLEETKFRKTLERGLSILEEETASLKRGDKLKGEAA